MNDQKLLTMGNRLEYLAEKLHTINAKRSNFSIDFSKSEETGYMKVRGRWYRYWLLKNPMWNDRYAHLLPESTRELLPHGGYNGYVEFRRRPVKEETYNGIVTYVPVHGGITYSYHAEDKSCSVYGFDTAHYDSDSYPIRNRDWIRHQIFVMVDGLLTAQMYEKAYLKGKNNNNVKMKYADRVSGSGSKEQRMNFGVMLNLLGGSL